VQFGIPYGIANRTGQVSKKEAKKMLDLASSKGIDTIDTAIAYGESEKCLGEVGIEKFKVITKLPAVPNGCPDIFRWIESQINASLHRLNQTSIYGVLLHRSEELLGIDGSLIFHALEKLKASGVVQKFGISIYSTVELDLLKDRYSVDIVQAPLNLVDNRLVETGWLKRLKDTGTEVHTRSAFLQGLLLMQHSEMPPKFALWDNLWEEWRRWQLLNSASALQACLAYPLSFPEIDRVVVGADSVEQLVEIVRYSEDTFGLAFPKIGCTDEALVNPSKWNQF
jgi:aryl-alcohol dehydrogenase-like predicted oxidoreductase